MKIDLNADLGEGFGRYSLGMDESIMQYISSANIACGFHASDPLIMNQTVTMAKKYDVTVGAHPGFPDLVGFGRRNMNVSAEELKAMVQYQIGALSAFCYAHSIPLSYVKPHGAMYNMAAKDMKMAMAIAQGIKEVDDNLVLLGLSGSCLIKAAKETGLMAANEVFADRAYYADGNLVERSREGAVLTDEEVVIERVIEMIRSKTVTTIDGVTIPIQADSMGNVGRCSRKCYFCDCWSCSVRTELVRSQQLSL